MLLPEPSPAARRQGRTAAPQLELRAARTAEQAAITRAAARRSRAKAEGRLTPEKKESDKMQMGG